ncbi:hypothetical protein LMIY3S_05454 [Labrys miyagiensis]
MSITIRPATLRDMTFVAAGMRAADWREIQAVFPASSTEIGAALYETSTELNYGDSLLIAGFAPRFLSESALPVTDSSRSTQALPPSGRPDVSASRRALVAAASSFVPSRSSKWGKRTRTGARSVKPSPSPER